MRILLSGGGTAGHVLPHIAVVEELRKALKLNKGRRKGRADGLDVLYVGSKNGPERELAQRWGFEYAVVPAGKLRRYWDWRNFTDVFKVILGVMKSLAVVWRFKPDVMFSKGGYVSLPPMIAAWMLRVPIVIHDSDSIPGLTTRVAARFTTTICLGYPSAARFFPKRNTVVTGIPLRREVLKGDRKRGLQFLGFKAKGPVVLVMGGSLGAERINRALEEALPFLKKRAQIVHLAGRGKIPPTLHAAADNRYKVFEYLDKELPDVYAASDVIVSRAGANSIAELESLGKAIVLVPLGRGASHGDQIENARVLEARGGAVVIADEALEGKLLKMALEVLLENSALRLNMGKKAYDNLHLKAGKVIANMIMNASK